MSDDRARRPAFLFFARDWLSDEALRGCSIAARGLWIDLLSYAHFGEPYGHLRNRNGKPLTVVEIARMVGESPTITRRLLAELENAGVCGKNSDGCLFSRRMVRDEKIRTARAAGGPKSLDHPNVPRKKGDSQGPTEGPKEGYPSPPSLGGSLALALASASSEEKEETLSTSSNPPADDLRILWNETTTEPIPRARVLTPQRRRHSVECLREHGIDGMRQVFARINASPFCRGQNDRGWLATFEWALNPDNIAKVLEGKYDPRRNPGPTDVPASPKPVHDPAKQRYGAMEFGK